MPSATLHPNQQQNIGGTAEVKVSDAGQTAGRVQVQCPNVPAVSYDVPASGSKDVQIPTGTSTFTNTGAIDLRLDW